MEAQLTDCPLQVIKRPMLIMGMLGSVSGKSAVIVLNSGMHWQEEAVTLWHEVIHLLKMAGNDDHDEEMIESAAQHLATLYPEIRKWVGIADESSNAQRQREKEIQ